jgi:hypothetical protein
LHNFCVDMNWLPWPLIACSFGCSFANAAFSANEFKYCSSKLTTN